MMVAINRETGCVIDIICTDSNSSLITGKVINDPSGNLKVGDIIHNFKKSLFSVIIEWETYDRVKEIVSILKPLIL